LLVRQKLFASRVARFCGPISLLALLLLPLGARAQQPIRVNCAGPNYTDSKGQLWQADFGFSGGTANKLPATVKGVYDQALFQKSRLNENSKSGLIYTFNVPNGEFRVNLYFAETWAQDQVVGARVFNVKLQGAAAFTNLDVFAEAGANAELVKGSDVSVTNGQIAIEFDDVVASAKIDAIEILPGASGPQVTLNFKYPDGTPVVGKVSYTISSTLLTFNGSEPLVNGQLNCALLANPSALGISMDFTVNASLTDAAGNVLWHVNVGMNPSQVNLATVQNSNLTVVVQKL
jgi:hypothetical protein